MGTHKKNSEQEQSKDRTTPGRQLTRNESRSPIARGRWPLTRLRTEFDRLFDDFFGGWPTVGAWSEEPSQRWGIDVEDETDQVIVRAEAPGFEPQDFSLQVHDNQLELCACQSQESSQDGGHQWHQQELFRSIPLPPGIDPEHVDAKYRNGILTVTLPKTEQSKGRTIEVKG